VRLDHLLSKELHRTSSAGVFTGECSVRVVLVVEGPSTSPSSESSDSSVLGGGRGLLEKCGITKLQCFGTGSTLLGPERTTGPPCGGLFVVSKGRSSARLPLVGLFGWRFVWSLRIVQWTRASFFCAVCVVIS
jgi:hypothetical protein